MPITSDESSLLYYYYNYYYYYYVYVSKYNNALYALPMMIIIIIRKDREPPRKIERKETNFLAFPVAISVAIYIEQTRLAMINIYINMTNCFTFTIGKFLLLFLFL